MFAGAGSCATVGHTRLRSRVGLGSSRPEEPKTAPSGARLDRCCSHWRCCSSAAATTMSPPCPPGRNQSAEVDTSTPGSTSCRPRRWPASSRGGSVVWSGPRCRTLSPDRAVRVWIRSPPAVVVSLTRTSGNASSSAASAAHRGGASSGSVSATGSAPQAPRPREPTRQASRPTATWAVAGRALMKPEAATTTRTRTRIRSVTLRRREARSTSRRRANLRSPWCRRDVPGPVDEARLYRAPSHFIGRPDDPRCLSR